MIWLWATWTLAAGPDPLLGCADEATEQALTRCVYMAARRTGAFEEARQVLGARPGPWAKLNLAHTVAATGGEAEVLYGEALEGFGPGEAEGTVKAWLGLRTLYDRAGRDDDVDRALDEAEANAEGSKVLAARVQVERARTAHRREQTEEAVRLARPVLEVPGIEYQTRLVALHVLAGALLELGQVQASWTFSEQLVALTASSGDAFVESNTRVNALLVAMDHPRLVDVSLEDYAETSLEVAERGDNPYAATSLRCVLADLRADGAGLRACVDGARELEDPYTEFMGLRALARHATDRTESEQWLDVAAPLAADDPFDQAQLAHARAEVAWRFGDEAASLAASREAVAQVEASRDGHGEELARAGYATLWRGAWEAPAARLVAAGRLEEAWGWSEAMRAQTSRAAGGPAVRGLAEVQEGLGVDEAVVAYVFPTERRWDAWAWVVRRDAVEVVPIDAEGLGTRIDTVLSLSVVSEMALDRLREQVWSPVSPHLEGVRHVAVVADGPLHRFPLGALLTEAGDPTLTRWETGTAPDPAPGRVEGVRSLVAPRGTTLPSALGEGERWVEALGGVLLAGDQAASTALVGPEGVLHVASHAVVERWVGVPRLQLADRWVDTRDVADLPLDDKVVVWAVCGGGDGPVYDAEGAFSLARAARRAGARAVVASAVALPDREAAEAFGTLAEVWRDGGRLDDAVAEMRRRHPQVGWAVEVHGDGGARVVGQPGSRVRWGLAAGSVLLVGMLLGALRHRRDRGGRSNR